MQTDSIQLLYKALLLSFLARFQSCIGYLQIILIGGGSRFWEVKRLNKFGLHLSQIQLRLSAAFEPRCVSLLVISGVPP